MSVSPKRLKFRYSSRKMIRSVRGTTTLSFWLGALHVLELPAPGEEIARREADLFAHGILRLGDIAADVALADVDEDVDGEQRVLGADGRRTFAHQPRFASCPSGTIVTVHHGNEHVGWRSLRGSVRSSRG